MIREERYSESSHAKLILLGEHAVLHGHSALALGLSDCRLTASWRAPQAPSPFSITWTENGSHFPLDPDALGLLLETWREALRLSSPHLSPWLEGDLQVASSFPPGAGLGASAALCVALIRLASRLTGLPPPLPVQAAATSLEALFHGRSSGLDPAACLADGWIAYRMSEGPRALTPQHRGFLAVMDSLERKQTRATVEAVRTSSTSPLPAAQVHRLGALAEQGIGALEAGQLETLGRCMNEAQDALRALSLSTPALEARVEALREAGALGAKLSGGGRGGVVVGLFEDGPPLESRGLKLPFPIWRWIAI